MSEEFRNGVPSPFGRGWREAPGEGFGSWQDLPGPKRANPAGSRSPHPVRCADHLLPMGEGDASAVIRAFFARLACLCHAPTPRSHDA